MQCTWPCCPSATTGSVRCAQIFLALLLARGWRSGRGARESGGWCARAAAPPLARAAESAASWHPSRSAGATPPPAARYRRPCAADCRAAADSVLEPRSASAFFRTAAATNTPSAAKSRTHGTTAPKLRACPARESRTGCADPSSSSSSMASPALPARHSNAICKGSPGNRCKGCHGTAQQCCAPTWADSQKWLSHLDTIE